MDSKLSTPFNCVGLNSIASSNDPSKRSTCIHEISIDIEYYNIGMVWMQCPKSSYANVRQALILLCFVPIEIFTSRPSVQFR